MAVVVTSSLALGVRGPPVFVIIVPLLPGLAGVVTGNLIPAPPFGVLGWKRPPDGLFGLIDNFSGYHSAFPQPVFP